MARNKRALLSAAVALALASAGCGRTASAGPRMPQYAYRSPDIRAGYEFAVGAGSELLRQLPCYCACAALGHTHLRDCFISDAGVFDSHAAGCEVCIDEALDAQRMLGRGTPVKEIRSAIDATYSKIGPGTSTPPVL